MKTLYLHIGTPKTATSSIQKFLTDNSENLEKKGYCFPPSQYTYPKVNPRRNGHFLIAKVRDENGKKDVEKEQWYWDEGMKQLREKFEKFDQVILSDESIWYCLSYRKKSVLRDLQKEAQKDHFQIKVIVYLRRQDDFLLSRWNQFIKQNMSYVAKLTCDEYFNEGYKKEEKLFEYDRKLDEIAEVIGKENLIVRRFEPKVWNNGSIIYDFMHEIGLDANDGFCPLEETVNLRIGKNETEMKRLINLNPDFSPKEIAYMGNFLKDISKDDQEKVPTAMLSKEEVQQFLAKYEAGNKRVEEEYIGDGKPLFSDTVKDLPKWSPQNDTMQQDTFRFFTAMMMDLYRENEQQKADIKELKKEVENLKKFRDKIKHPSRIILGKIAGKDEK